VRAVERGTRDLTTVAALASAPLRAVLRTRYSGQLHANADLATNGLEMNTRVSPFSSLKARQAVAYAINRNEMARLRGGPDVNPPTCQFLPPNVSGYQHYCPYKGPNLARARQLVAASGTKGELITFRGGKGFIDKSPLTPYLLSVLRKIGYKTRLETVPPSKFGSVWADPHSKWQAIPFGWLADFPAASNFFTPNFTCASFRPGPTNGNFSEFCDPKIDAEIAHASALETADQQAAAKIWAKVDHDLVDQAPWVPYLNVETLDFTSSRVGNYVYNAWIGGALLDQMWVR
jgi:peptide/nickel transport system substrate-binding protein